MVRVRTERIGRLLDLHRRIEDELERLREFERTAAGAMEEISAGTEAKRTLYVETVDELDMSVRRELVGKLMKRKIGRDLDGLQSRIESLSRRQDALVGGLEELDMPRDTFVPYGDLVRSEDRFARLDYDCDTKPYTPRLHLVSGSVLRAVGDVATVEEVSDLAERVESYRTGGLKSKLDLLVPEVVRNATLTLVAGLLISSIALWVIPILNKDSIALLSVVAAGWVLCGISSSIAVLATLVCLVEGIPRLIQIRRSLENGK